MLRSRLCAVLGFCLMLVAASTQARELELSIDGRVGGDSNVLRSSQQKVEDAFFELSPRLALREKHRALSYDFAYRPTYATYVDTENVDGVDHLATAKIDWRITPADTIGIDARHANERRLRFDAEDVGGETVLEAGDRERIRRSDVSAFYQRSINQAFSVAVRGAFDDFDTASTVGSEIQPDSRAYSGTLSGSYVLDERTSVGLSVSGRFRETKATQLGQVSSETRIWDVAASVSRALTPTLQVSVQAGPSFIETEQIPKFPGARNSTSQSVSYFATASLDKQWRNATAGLDYVRSESRSGTSGSSAIADDVSATFTYRLRRKWTAVLVAGWNRRKQIQGSQAVPGGNDDLDVTRYRGAASLRYQLTRHVSAIAQYTFSRQTTNGARGAVDLGNIHIGYLSLRYTFDPVIF